MGKPEMHIYLHLHKTFNGSSHLNALVKSIVNEA